jgi:hypothetical protein
MFEATHPFAPFDYLRVPYSVSADPEPATGDGELGALWIEDGPGRQLLWVRAEADVPGPAGRFHMRGFDIVGSIMDDERARSLLAGRPEDWRPFDDVLDGSGERVGSVWMSSDGSVFVPFDPGRMMHDLWSETYLRSDRSRVAMAAGSVARRCYYAVRPILPRHLQIQIRRGFRRVQGQAEFPRWPIEDSLDSLITWTLSMAARVAQRPVPWIGPWPDGHSWAIVLTHDVETDAGVRAIELLRGEERRAGYRSSWNFVPERYQVADDVLDALRDEDCEIGVHGLRHDGKDLGSRRLMARRIPAMRRAADRWGSDGFRSPATQRRWEWMPELGFGYDTSYPDTDPYEPQPGGCCSILPFHNGEMIELPITLPQDHTLFTILGQGDGSIWLNKARHIKDRGGMMLILTHPDYAADPVMTSAYAQLLSAYRDDHSAWHALPREVASWWRDRAASTIEREGEGWRVRGPSAGRAQVALALPTSTVHA